MAVLISQLSVNSDSNLVANIVSSVLPMISQIGDENVRKKPAILSELDLERPSSTHAHNPCWVFSWRE